MMVTARTILAAILSFAAGAAEAQSYRWESAGAPPANAVVGAGGKKRPVCTFDAPHIFLGSFRDGQCHSQDGQLHSGTKNLRFLVAVSGPAGGKWVKAVIDGNMPVMPRNTALDVVPDRYTRGMQRYICSIGGIPGIGNYRGEPSQPKAYGSGCPAAEQPEGSQDQWVLVRGD